MRAFGERQLLETRRDSSLAWYTAAFSRAKKLPALDRLLRRLGAPFGNDKRAMPWQEMAAAARAWTKALGGTTKKKG